MNTSDGLIKVTCHRCDFFKSDEDEDLKCGAFLLLMKLLDKGAISLEELGKL